MTGPCCVVGGTGFIGRAVVEKLAESGRDVIVIGRRAEADDLPQRVRYLALNPLDRAGLDRALVGVTEVVDLAHSTTPKSSFDDPSADFVEHLPYTIGLLNACVRAGVSKFVYASSGGTVYGVTDSLPITEDHPARPMSPYGVTKFAAERYVDIYAAAHGLSALVVRPGNAYGEEQSSDRGQGFVAIAIRHCLDGEPVTVYGNQGTIRDYIYVSDVAAGIIAALEHGARGSVYNLGTGVGTSNTQILERIAVLAAAEGVHPPKVWYKSYRPYDVPANILDSSRLRQVSGWRPLVALDEGLARCWAKAR